MDGHFGIDHRGRQLQQLGLESRRWESAASQYHEPESDVRNGRDPGDDKWSELWGDAGDEHGEVQWSDGDGDELECGEYRSAGASRSNDGKRSGDGRRSGQQRREFYGHCGYHATGGNYNGAVEQCDGSRDDYPDGDGDGPGQRGVFCSVPG